MWETRLVTELSVTRILLLGALLIVLMSWRPQGLLGTARVGIRLDGQAARIEGDLEGVLAGLQVIDRLDLHVDEGEIVSVYRLNGAGKTTLFNLITGVYRPDHGEILLEGRSLVGRRRTRSRSRSGPANVPDAPPLPEHEREGERDGCRQYRRTRAA